MGSLRMSGKAIGSVLPESSCGYLLQELKMIWDEVGQDENERGRILEELEQECQEVYRRKVNSANMSRIQLHQALADSEAEFTNLLLSLGERSFPGRPEKMTGTLKEQLNAITPALQEMQMRKEVRVKQFMEIQTEIQRIASEIAGHTGNEAVTVNEEDLSLKKLEEYQNELQRLKREKSDRLCKVEEYKVLIHNSAKVMGMDPSKILANIHPSLINGPNEQQTKNISDDILKKLHMTVQQLKEEKNSRRDKLHSLVKALTNLWNILDITMEERQPFGQIKMFGTISTNSALGPGSLTLETVQQVESEVHRLEQLKASKMKDVFLKKRAEVDEICKKSHMDMPYQTEMDTIMDMIISGDVGHNDLLKTMDEYIYKTKEEATSRKDISSSTRSAAPPSKSTEEGAASPLSFHHLPSMASSSGGGRGVEGGVGEGPTTLDELYQINVVPAELHFKFRKELQGLRVGLNFEFYNLVVNDFEAKVVLKPLDYDRKWKFQYKPTSGDIQLLSKKIPVTKFLSLQVGIGHNYHLNATGWKWKLSTCLGADGVSQIRNKSKFSLFPGFDLRIGWKAEYVLPEIHGAVGTGEPAFSMNYGRLQASIDRVEAIVTQSDRF